MVLATWKSFYQNRKGFNGVIGAEATMEQVGRVGSETKLVERVWL